MQFISNNHLHQKEWMLHSLSIQFSNRWEWEESTERWKIEIGKRKSGEMRGGKTWSESWKMWNGSFHAGFHFCYKNNGFCKEMYGTNGRYSVKNKKRRGPMKINVLRHLNSNYHEGKGKRFSHTSLIQAVWYEDGREIVGDWWKKGKV